jgi:hypothetical protein
VRRRLRQPVRGAGAVAHGFLLALEPAHPGAQQAGSFNVWQTYIDVARSRTTYGWPNDTILDRMYNPVSTSDGEAPGTGLGMSAAVFLPYTTRSTSPAASSTACGRHSGA